LPVTGRDSSFALIVFERRFTGVNDDGVELERTPLLQHLERPIPRPEPRVRVPPSQFFFEEFLVVTGNLFRELVFTFHLNQVHGVLLVDLGQGEGVRRGGGIGGIDPIDEGLLVPKDQGCPLEHDRCTGGSSAQVEGAFMPRGHGTRGSAHPGSPAAAPPRVSLVLGLGSGL
jgi:hypothetical protein